MEYIIGGLAIIIILFLSGFLLRKKFYHDIDRLEGWKIDIMNRPVLDEMSKVKQLNMTGQTEKLFERWREEWDEIVTTRLPAVEDLLFDAEEFIDKYRFGKSKEVQSRIERELTETEEQIKSILHELHELVGSEEKNRAEIDGLKEQYRENKKTLLAHRHNYGKAEAKLEQNLDSVMAKFEDFDDKTNQGNYLEAREVVLVIKDELEKINYCLENLPHLLVECQSTIPGHIHEVKEGCREMTAQGYVLDHLQLDKETDRLETELAAYVAYLEQAEISEVENGIQALKESVENLFDLLEREVDAKRFISQHGQGIKNFLEKLLNEKEQLKAETLSVQQSYHLAENDLKNLAEMEKHLSELAKRHLVLETRLAENDTAQSVLGEELREVQQLLEAVLDEQKEYAQKLQTLRKDEMSAHEKVAELKKKIAETIRSVSKSNIPGLSHTYQYLLDDANESIQNVVLKLEEKPLDIPAVQRYLEVAVLTVEKLANTTLELVENAMLAEKVIQYGNRYRSRYPSVAKGLVEAESAFRSFDYQAALEQAATSIEEVEPGALRKIEMILAKE
ncbi:septation ring formation regulator EzrA [Bacillus canaveralius]|uniref:Septation ring formation regulator EzrA n=1 Tax=Bacillus canaveralius TaxID=1403243 RepID=A0A2N5GNE1_9BACI|nr:septation ring formation regulator EzrA [Bacillus canaveralius]PLR83711.1 septation ring formation regulator EzrA [Bacillus canaveralius]PLR95187.1 septation ring formation regulator EzrA [Bacillus canaveralius]